MTAPSLLHHVVYILSELVPWFILASVWILFHKDKFCHRAVVCFNVSKQPVDYIFLYKFTEPICSVLHTPEGIHTVPELSF